MVLIKVVDIFVIYIMDVKSKIQKDTGLDVVIVIVGHFIQIVKIYIRHVEVLVYVLV